MSYEPIPRKNILNYDKGASTTDDIQTLLKHFRRVLLIVDETSTIDYNIPSVQKISIYKVITDNLLEERLVINCRKFILLAKQGYIKPNDYDIFIFRLIGMGKELMDCFKIFYHLSSSKTPVVCYFDAINKFDDVFMACTSEEDFTNVSNVFVETKNDIEVTEYTNLKAKIFEIMAICPAVKTKIETLENISYRYALLYIKQNFNIDIDEVDHIEVDPQLSINDFKFKDTIRQINDNKKHNIYIKCVNSDIIKYLKLQIAKDVTIKEYHSEIVNVENSILIVYDPCENFNYPKNFYRIIIYHENDSNTNLTNLFKNFCIDENNPCYTMQKYLGQALEYTRIEATGAFYDYMSSYTILLHFFYLIQQMLKEEYFFLKSSILRCNYIEKLGEFQCSIIFPDLHEQFEVIKGSYRGNKNDARKCAAYKALHFLREKNFIDSNLCPSKMKLIEKNKLFYYHICKTYNISILDKEEKNKTVWTVVSGDKCGKLERKFEMYIEQFGLNNEIVKREIEKLRLNYITKRTTSICTNEAQIISMFERDYRINIGFKDITGELDLKHNIDLPLALKNYDKVYSIYNCKQILSDGEKVLSNLGICAGKAFTETLTLYDSEISFSETYEFSDDELTCLLFFQTVLFVQHFKNIRHVSAPSKEYCYFFVPMKDGKLHIEYLKTFSITNFLISNVYKLKNKSLLRENLLFNPFLKKFFVYDEPCFQKITEFGQHEGQMTYLEYFEGRYRVKLKELTGDNLLFYGFSYEGAIGTQKNVLSSEILYLTNLKINFCKDYQRIKKDFYAFEKMALAHDLKEKMKLDISTQILLRCLSPKWQNYDNYERLEFLGDSVLKFVCSKYLFNFNLGECVTKKDSLLSNEALYEIAKNHGIVNVFSFANYNDSYFQPPSILKFLDHDGIGDNIKKFITYFNAESVFMSRNVTFNELKVKQQDDKVKGLKTYADVIEAMIGAYYSEFDLEKCECFISMLGITKQTVQIGSKISNKNTNSHDVQKDIIKGNISNKLNEINNVPNTNQQELLIKNTNEQSGDLSPDKFSKNYNNTVGNIKGTTKQIVTTSKINKLKEYQNILKNSEVESIEKILNYKFKHPGLIEKAMIHPSSHNNILGSLDFNKLELLGDCALDLVVTDKIYNEYVNFNPERMHCKRKSLVNNFSLARLLFKRELDINLHICFDEQYKNTVKDKLRCDGGSVNKAFGDVLESILGAILIDMDFNYQKFKKYIYVNIYDDLEACSDTTR